MRLYTIPIFLSMMMLLGISVPRDLIAQNEGEWIKYVTWEGEVDDMLILRIDKEMVKADYPVGSGFRNAKVTFYAGDPDVDSVAKVEVHEGRGSVAICKQSWQPPEKYLKVQIYDKPQGWGKYKFTVYYLEKKLTPTEKAVVMKEVNKAVYEFDVYQLNRALESNNLSEALRWARSAYEIDRLNWDMLNTIGEIYYKMNSMKNAEDVFVILRDYGYLTEENKKRFKEISPYEYSKLEEKEKAKASSEEEEESGAQEEEQQEQNEQK